MLKNVRHPILFQGNLSKKIISKVGILNTFLPISLNEGDPHSFIQYILVQTDEQGENAGVEIVSS